MTVVYLALLLAQVGGNQKFAVRCAACHGADGRSDQDVRELIRKGFPAAGMPGFEIPEPKRGDRGIRAVTGVVEGRKRSLVGASQQAHGQLRGSSRA